MGSAVKFRQSKFVQQPGELARLKVVQGPDAGCTFVVTGPRASMGRGDENDIVLGDLKASRRHAEIIAASGGDWRVKDIGSANGIFLDGQTTREGLIRRGSRFMIGETLLEFEPAGASQDRTTLTGVLPARSVGTLPGMSSMGLPGTGGAAASGTTSIAGLNLGGSSNSEMNPRKMLLWGVIFVGAYLVLFVDPETEQISKKPQEKAQQRNLASFLPDYEAGKSGPAETFFREGFREYRERNHLRAKTQFETVLQIAPGHYLASVYLRKCEEEIAREVETHLIQGRKDAEAGKLKSAKNHYESVLRLLYRDRTHASYVEAKESLSSVEKAMKGEATL